MVVRSRERKVPKTERPKPSITIDLSYQRSDGGAHQERPTFDNIDKAVAYLRSLKPVIAKLPKV